MEHRQVLPWLLLIGGGGLLVLVLRSREAAAADVAPGEAPASLLDRLLAVTGLAQSVSPDGAGSPVVIRQGAAVTAADGGSLAGIAKTAATAISTVATAAKVIPSLFTAAAAAPAATAAAGAGPVGLTISQVIGEPALAGVSVPLLLEAAGPAAEAGLAGLIGVGPALGVGAAMIALPVVLVALTGGFSDVNREQALGQLRVHLDELARYGNDVERLRREAPHVWAGLVMLYSRAKFAASIGRGDEVDTPLSAYPPWLVPSLEADVLLIRQMEASLQATAAAYNTTRLAYQPDIVGIVLGLQSRLGRAPTFEEAERAVITATLQFNAAYQPDTGR